MCFCSITGNRSYLTGIAMERLLMSLQIKMSWKVFSTGITCIRHVYATAVRYRMQVIVLYLSIYACTSQIFCYLLIVLIFSFTHLLFHSFTHLLILLLLLILLICSFYSFYSFAHSTHLLILLICCFTLLLIWLIFPFTHSLILLIYSFYSFTHFAHFTHGVAHGHNCLG